eukprot:s1117_g16.t2
MAVSILFQRVSRVRCFASASASVESNAQALRELLLATDAASAARGRKMLGEVLRPSLGPFAMTHSSWAALCDVRWICLQRCPAWCSLSDSEMATLELVQSWPGEAQRLQGISAALEEEVAETFHRLGCKTEMTRTAGHLKLPLCLSELKILILCLEDEASTSAVMQLHRAQLEETSGWRLEVLLRSEWGASPSTSAQELLLRQKLAQALQSNVPRRRRVSFRDLKKGRSRQASGVPRASPSQRPGAVKLRRHATWGAPGAQRRWQERCHSRVPFGQHRPWAPEGWPAPAEEAARCFRRAEELHMLECPDEALQIKEQGRRSRLGLRIGAALLGLTALVLAMPLPGTAQGSLLGGMLDVSRMRELEVNLSFVVCRANAGLPLPLEQKSHISPEAGNVLCVVDVAQSIGRIMGVGNSIKSVTVNCDFKSIVKVQRRPVTQDCALGGLLGV